MFLNVNYESQFMFASLELIKHIFENNCVSNSYLGRCVSILGVLAQQVSNQ